MVLVSDTLFEQYGYERYKDYDGYVNVESYQYKKNNVLPAQFTFRYLDMVNHLYREFDFVVLRIDFIPQNAQRPYVVRGYFKHDTVTIG